MKITAVETIPVRLPVGKFSDGMHKVWGTNAPERYDTGGPEKREELQGQGEMLLSNVIVKIHTDEGITGIGEAACDVVEPIEQYNVNLEILEQPVGTMDLDGTKQIKESTSIPVEVDESAFSLSQVHQIVKCDVADVINTKCAKAGGIRGVELWAAIAEAADLPIVIGTEWGTGLKVAAKLHLGAAIKNADPVVEFTEIMIHELLLEEPVKLHDGYIDVPTTSGLGMALDGEKIEAFRIDK